MKIVLLDDHILLSETLANVLQQRIPGSEIKVFKNGELFLAADFKTWEPDLVIADMLMPGPNGIEVMEKAFLQFGRQYKFIFLSSIVDVHTIKNAMRMGGSGYLSKDTPIEEVLEAIEVVMDGEQYIGKNLKDSLVKYVFAEDQITFHLSPRQKEVLEMVCKGKTPKEIAYETGLSQHTVQEYLKAIMRKFKVNRTTDLVVFAIQKGLYNPGIH